MPFNLIGRIGFCYSKLELVPLICYRWRCIVKADCSALYDSTMWCPLVFKRIIRFDFWSLHPIGKAKSTLGKNDISIFRQKWLSDFLLFWPKILFDDWIHLKFCLFWIYQSKEEVLHTKQLGLQKWSNSNTLGRNIVTWVVE